MEKQREPQQPDADEADQQRASGEENARVAAP
jgi:hypothetical protein